MIEFFGNIIQAIRRSSDNHGLRSTLDTNLADFSSQLKVELARRATIPLIRLKERITLKGEETSDGFGPLGLTFGELSDICVCYCTMVGDNGSMAKTVLGRIARSQLNEIDEDYVRLFLDAAFDLSDNLESDQAYNHLIDLSLLRPSSQDDLTHYPGGLMMVEREDRFWILLTNRQQSDKHVSQMADILGAVGLPVKHN